MRALVTHLDEEPREYTGRELRSHFALETYGLHGDSCVAFLGPAHLGPEAMVDLEDVREGETIESRRMLHLIAEHFEEGLTTTVLRQRLLVHLAGDLLRRESGCDVRVTGDDLYLGDRKLSVSIATRSPLSGLIHLGVNVTGEGAPVKAGGLDDLGLDPFGVARELLELYREECESVHWAARKTRWVR
ncbi:MAG: DUF366 family protein [Planctomycetota bacterium]